MDSRVGSEEKNKEGDQRSNWNELLVCRVFFIYFFITTFFLIPIVIIIKNIIVTSLREGNNKETKQEIKIDRERNGNIVRTGQNLKLNIKIHVKLYSHFYLCCGN